MTRCTITDFVLLLSTGVAAISPPTASETLKHNSSAVLWTDCSTTYGPGFTCANYSVPVDWRNPSSEHVVLGMNRYQSNATSRNGGKKNLFVNYGGPGIITTQTLPLTLIGFSDEITSKFDLIALDPRGIGSSSPIQCDVDLWNERISLFPKTERDFTRLVHHNKAFGRSCLEKSGKLLYHMDTKSVARDFEAIRIALGDEPINVLGLSYGSQIAYQYAQLFPHNIRTLVGDGILDHSESETSLLASETQTYEDSFNRFAAWAGTSNESALIGQDVVLLVHQLVSQANHSPIPVGSGPGHFDDITGDELLFNLQDLLISKTAGIGPGWPAVSQILALAATGNGTGLTTLAPAAVKGDVQGNSVLFGGLAVNCADWTHHSTKVADLLYKQQLTENWAPHTRGHVQSYTAQTRCVGWPAAVVNPPWHQIEVHTETPILLVQSLHDPECSYTWAVNVQAQIPSSTLLTLNGDGHTSYFTEGETTGAMNAYLVDGTVPAPNTVLES
ncbi:hypothetical protein LTR56_008786 [Elasticomyces elasticus]|nr:hypothetical protein LTR22_021966 [Elasticomyces elasticus]KAK3645908.1 hypothetical protein LTR56_008786 [Elasticomyces elasticus]KAK4928141.1 hypothetical protein LTR49_005079 [Elasticomyces elasticus]KAK5765893.1 hypothetical protein LTS12_003900 [Elasticomyces elasticus]